MYVDLVSQIIESDGKSTISVKIKPNASKTSLIYKKGLYALVQAKPKLGKANQELVALLKEKFQTDDVVIAKGHKSRKKLIRIGLGKNEIISHLSNL